MPDIEVQGRIGPVFATDGAVATARLTRGAAFVAQDEHARYAEALVRGQLFQVSTAVAGVAPGTALSTTPPLVLHNPANSNRVAVVSAALLAYVSGTLGAGAVVLAGVLQPSPPTGGALLTPSNGLVGSTSAPTCKCYQGSTLAGAPTIIRPSFTLGAALATTALFAQLLRDDVQGEIGVLPGSALCLQGVAAAGVSPLVLLGLAWEEFQVL